MPRIGSRAAHGSDQRLPVVAGRFYPAREAALREQIEALLEGVARKGARCAGAMVPHAGLFFSGRTAGLVFGRIEVPESVVILAPNHTGVFASPGASVWSRGSFRTPLGDVPVEETLAERLLAFSPLAAHDPLAHMSEHAIEVELPFLQVLAPGARIVPVVLSFDDWTRTQELASALAAIVRESVGPVLLLASSDMTHYEPARSVDRKDALALEAIAHLDGRTLLEICRTERISMCGRVPVACVAEACRQLGASRGEKIDHRHSGWVTGEEESVVGYAGVAFF